MSRCLNSIRFRNGSNASRMSAKWLRNDSTTMYTKPIRSLSPLQACTAARSWPVIAICVWHRLVKCQSFIISAHCKAVCFLPLVYSKACISSDLRSTLAGIPLSKQFTNVRMPWKSSRGRAPQKSFIACKWHTMCLDPNRLGLPTITLWSHFSPVHVLTNHVYIVQNSWARLESRTAVAWSQSLLDKLWSVHSARHGLAPTRTKGKNASVRTYTHITSRTHRWTKYKLSFLRTYFGAGQAAHKSNQWATERTSDRSTERPSVYRWSYFELQTSIWDVD